VCSFTTHNSFVKPLTIGTTTKGTNGVVSHCSQDLPSACSDHDPPLTRCSDRGLLAGTLQWCELQELERLGQVLMVRKM
jgi:hypothetical protein